MTAPDETQNDRSAHRRHAGRALLADPQDRRRRHGRGLRGQPRASSASRSRSRCCATSTLDRPEVAQRLVQEARLASSIRHEHIIDITDSGATERRAHLRGHGAARRAEPGRAASAARARCPRRAPLGIVRAGGRRRSAPRTRAASSTATSSRRTSSSSTRGGSDFVKVVDFGISKSMRAGRAPTTDVAAAHRRPAWCWARRSTCRPSRRAATRISITASTSTRSA